jgi:hypothetical protein
MLSQYMPPTVPNWRFVTNSESATAEDAEAEYRAAVVLARQHRGLSETAFDVLVRAFSVTNDPEIRWAVYARAAV